MLSQITESDKDRKTNNDIIHVFSGCRFLKKKRKKNNIKDNINPKKKNLKRQ